MTAKGIQNLVRQLFKDGPLDPVYNAAGRRVSVDEIEQRALIDPGFLGELVVWFSQASQPLPEFITHPALVRTNRFLLEPGRPDPDVKVALACAMNLPGSEAQRDLLRAVLTCEGITLESTATLLGTDLEVVSLFELLHWNVLDRKLDRPYIARLCRQIRFRGVPGGVRAVDALGPVLLRIADELGSPEAVLAAAEVSPLNDSVEIQTLLRRRRSNRLASVAVGVAVEKLGDKENPHLRAVLQMIATRKKAKAENEVVVPTMSIDESARSVLEGLIGATKQRDPKDSSPPNPCS